MGAAAPREALYTRAGGGAGAPLQRYTVSGILGGGQQLPLDQGNPLLVRHSVARLSRSSQATVDSGRYSDLRQVLSIRVEKLENDVRIFLCFWIRIWSQTASLRVPYLLYI